MASTPCIYVSSTTFTPANRHLAEIGILFNEAVDEGRPIFSPEGELSGFCYLLRHYPTLGNLRLHRSALEGQGFEGSWFTVREIEDPAPHLSLLKSVKTSQKTPRKKTPNKSTQKTPQKTPQRGPGRPKKNSEEKYVPPPPEQCREYVEPEMRLRTKTMITIATQDLASSSKPGVYLSSKTITNIKNVCD